MKIVKLTTRIVPALLATILISSCMYVSKANNVSVQSEARLPVDNMRLLVGRSALIFKGVVSGVEYETDSNTGLPFTYVTFRQIEPIKASSGEFTSGKRNKLRIRLFGGLQEDGTITLMTHIPSFTLGAVYVVFYTGGEWDVSPIVGGERGVFQVVRSRTLGYEMVLDYDGNVVVGIDDQSLKTLPLDGQNSKEMMDVETQEDKIAAKQTDQVEVDRDSIYTEENVERMMADEEEAKIEFEKEDETNVQQDPTRSQILRELSSPPISLEAFIQRVLEIDERDAGKFQNYSELRLEGNPVERERNPVELKQK